MASDRVLRRIERLLDQAEEAADQSNWDRVRELAENILNFAPGHNDAEDFLAAAERGVSRAGRPGGETPVPANLQPTTSKPEVGPEQPTSFANGRYEVKRFLGEGGKKKVYLAQDTLLDREVAFALIKTEGLDEVSRTRNTREA